MKKRPSVKRISLCAMCIALCYVLPIAFHSLGLGGVLSPMHLPVLLCGILCGPAYGAFCGVVGPVLSSVLSGMPPAGALVGMIPELLTYGLVCGIMMKLVRTKKPVLDIYLSLLPAMLAGRLAGGAANALFYLGTAGEYSFAVFVSSYFVGTFPAVVLQLVLIPLLVFTLEKTRAIPARYPQTEQETL